MRRSFAYGDGRERRTIALHAGVVVITRRCVNLSLLAELGLGLLQAHAVAFPPAVSAVLTSTLIDNRVFDWRFDCPSLDPAATLIGTEFVVYQHRDAVDLLELLRYCDEIVARSHLHALAQPLSAVLSGILCANDDPSDTLRLESASQRGQAALSGSKLRTSIGHDAVPEQLERHSGICRDGPTHIEVRRVVDRAVSHMLNEMRPIGKRREAHPCAALAAVMGHRVDMPFRLVDDFVETAATGSSEGNLTRAQDGTGAMWTTGAEVRRSRLKRLVVPVPDCPERREAGESFGREDLCDPL